MQRVEQTGSVAPGQMGGHKPKAISGEHAVWLSQRIRAGDFTLRGLVAELGGRGLKVDYRSVWEFVRRSSASKKAWWLANAIVPTWRGGASSGQSIKTGSNLSGWSSSRDLDQDRYGSMRGWALRGHRLIAKVPHGGWNTMTFLAALRHDRIEAPWFIEGPIDGESFRTYIAEVLLPTLRPGDIVVLDNLGSHRGKAVRQLIRSAGAKLFFLPKYSPDLNAIEQVFAKLKHLTRKAAARTVDGVCAAIGDVLHFHT